MTRSSLNRPVLVVDDEADIRDLMEMTLMKMGLSVDTAEGVAIAKNKLNQSKYSLVLTDMRMPDGSGLEVVEHITKNQMDTPVAVITAFGNADQAVQALKIGAFDYLQKPITLAQLRTLVKSAIKVQDEHDAPPVAAPKKSDDKEVNEWNDIADTLKQPTRSSRGRNPSSGSLKAEKTIQSDKIDKPELIEKSDKLDKIEVVDSPSGSLKKDSSVPRIMGSSQQIEEARRLIRKLADSNVPVFMNYPIVTTNLLSR